jgi:hypothetical protein
MVYGHLELRVFWIVPNNGVMHSGSQKSREFFNGRIRLRAKCMLAPLNGLPLSDLVCLEEERVRISHVCLAQI